MSVTFKMRSHILVRRPRCCFCKICTFLWWYLFPNITMQIFSSNRCDLSFLQYCRYFFDSFCGLQFSSTVIFATDRNSSACRTIHSFSFCTTFLRYGLCWMLWCRCWLIDIIRLSYASFITLRPRLPSLCDGYNRSTSELQWKLPVIFKTCLVFISMFLTSSFVQFKIPNFDVKTGKGNALCTMYWLYPLISLHHIFGTLLKYSLRMLSLLSEPLYETYLCHTFFYRLDLGSVHFEYFSRTFLLSLGR